MEISPAAKVGIITVLGLVVLGLILTSVYSGARIEGTPYYALFERVEGLAVGAPVRLAGVQVGKVTDIVITEDKHVRVQFNITYTQNQQPLVITQGSRYTITSDLLGNHWFEIVPRSGAQVAEKGTVQGTSPVTLDEVMTKGNEALSDLQASVKEINKLVADPEMKRNIRETVANFKELSKDMRVAAANANAVVTNLNLRISTISGHLDQTIVSLHGQLASIGGDFQSLAATLRRIGDRSEPDIRTIVLNLRDMSSSVRKTMAQVQKLVTNKEMNDDVLAMVSALKRTAQELEGVAADVRGITSDPEIAKDIKDAVRDARETMAGAKDIVQSVQSVVGGLKGVSGKGKGGFRFFEMRSEMEYNLSTQHLMNNSLLTVLPTLRYNLLLGMDSIGYQNLVNAQVGYWVNKDQTVRLRGGSIRSKVGVGLDTLLFERLNLSADVYDPRLVKVDFLGRLAVSTNLYLMGGVRDALRQSRSPVVGVGARF
ncbi:MAG: MCE family protein [Proteobacteria bacterium]|nr:MCE family protein [Pseudomonadota bacterium]